MVKVSVKSVVDSFLLMQAFTLRSATPFLPFLVHNAFTYITRCTYLLPHSCPFFAVDRDGGGAPPSFVIDPAAILRLQPYWVVLCPCGLDMEMTCKEAAAITEQPWW